MLTSDMNCSYYSTWQQMLPVISRDNVYSLLRVAQADRSYIVTLATTSAAY